MVIIIFFSRGRGVRAPPEEVTLACPQSPETANDWEVGGGTLGAFLCLSSRENWTQAPGQAGLQSQRKVFGKKQHRSLRVALFPGLTATARPLSSLLLDDTI